MANKKTVVELYKEILANPTLTEEQKQFIEKRIEITEKKNASGRDNTKLTEKQKENVGYKATMIANMTTNPLTVAEISNLHSDFAGLSNQKISTLLTQLLNDGKVVRTVIKGKPHYSLPSAE